MNDKQKGFINVTTFDMWVLLIIIGLCGYGVIRLIEWLLSFVHFTFKIG